MVYHIRFFSAGKLFELFSPNRKRFIDYVCLSQIQQSSENPNMYTQLSEYNAQNIFVMICFGSSWYPAVCLKIKLRE
jgi:hypothetical protein